MAQLRCSSSRRFKNSTINHHLDFIVAGEDHLKPKPHSDLFKLALKEDGSTNPDCCLMVGDNFNCDVIGAHQLGIASCWYNPERIANKNTVRATYTIDRLDQLLAL